ncbi:MAG: CDP-glycerol glycerophosphotransferase family protein [Bacteroidales bacterium]|nr:CDP-glycerol glycerophosphotransferase family protein [Bacteroidales bacterium]
MISVIINRTLSPGEMDEIRVWAGSGEYKIFSLKELSVEMEDIGVMKFDLPPEKKAEINHSMLKTMVDFGDKIVNSKSISDWFSFEKAGIYYFQKFRTYFYVRELAYEHAAIEMQNPEYKKVIYFSENNDLESYSGFSSEVVIRSRSDMKSRKISYLSLFNYILFVLIRSFFALLRIKRLVKIDHIVLDHTRRQPCLDIRTLKTIQDNYVFSYLFDKLDSEFVILNFAQMPKFLSGGKFRITRHHFSSVHKDKTRFYGEYILLRAILSSKVRKRLKDISKSLFGVYNIIESSALSKQEKFIIARYRALHKSSMLYMLKYFAYDRFFLKYSFKTISAIDENSPGVKSILDAAKKNNMTTIGIQHGALSDLHIAYMYSKHDKEKKVMTDHTLLWGDKWKDTLVKDGNFPHESIKITGQPRTDIIPKLNSVDKQSILKHIEPGKKLVVFASQPQQDPKLRRQAAVDVFKAVRDLEEVFLVIKPHPIERNDAGYYHNLAKETACSNYKIMHDIDLFLLLSVCDILITAFSTVGTETVYFYKPLIIHDPLMLDMQRYHKEGVAFQATNDSELKNYIEKILKGVLTINKDAYDKYISRNAYKIDGKASERCVKFIKSL